MTVIGRKGGMDHIADLTTDQVEARSDLNIHITRLVTRGDCNILLGSIIFLLALARFVVAALRGQVDLLHINLAAYGSAYRKIIIARIARFLGIPYVVHLHGGRFVEFWPAAMPVIRRAVDRMFLESAKIIVLGQFWADFIVDRVSVVGNKIVILPNATNAVSIGEPSDDAEIKIVYLGALSPLKGVPELIEAFAKLADRSSWSATVAGPGEILGARTRVQKLGIGDRVTIPGWLGPGEVDRILRRAHILVLPSHIENLPLSVLEGFAYGLAVVATPVGAIPEVIQHERNGLIVPVGDIDALAATLRRLIEDRELRLRLGAAARQDHADRYDIRVYVSRLAAIWREAQASQARIGRAESGVAQRSDI